MDQNEIADTSQQCKLVLETALLSLEAVHKVLKVLQERSEVRNHLFKAEISYEPAISTKVLFDSFFGPHTHQRKGGMRFDESTGTLFLSPHCPEQEIGKGKNMRIKWVQSNVLTPLFKVTTVFRNFTPSFPFTKALLGVQFSKWKEDLSFGVIHQRLLCAATRFQLELDDPKQLLGSQKGYLVPGIEHAGAWCSVPLRGEVNINNLLMEACLAFQTRLRVIANEGKGYLDQAAKVKYLAPVEKRSDNINAQSPIRPSKKKKPEGQQHGDKISTHPLRNAAGQLLGTVFRWRNCLSPAYTAYMLQHGLPSMHFLRDGLSNSDRLFRVGAASPSTYFQVRKPPRSTLIQADHITPFEITVLDMCKYLQRQLHVFVSHYVRVRHGDEAVTLVLPPLTEEFMVDETQCVITPLNDGGFSRHDDSGQLLSDDDGAGPKKFDHCRYMTVATLVVSNQPCEATEVSWFEKGADASKAIATVKTGGNDLHWQTYMVQWNCEHAASHIKNVPHIVPNDDRMVISTRCTGRFQESGLAKILHIYGSRNVKRKRGVEDDSNVGVSCIGDRSDYNYTRILGGEVPENSARGEAVVVMTNTLPSQTIHAKSAKAKKKFILPPTTKTTPNKDPGAGSNFSKALPEVASDTFEKTPGPYPNWPGGRERFIKSSLSPSDLFTSEAGITHLLKMGICPRIHRLVPGNPAATITKDFGVLLKENSDGDLQPVLPGTSFSETAIYRSMGLSHSKADSEVWESDFRFLGNIFLRQCYKSEFPTGCVDVEPRGPHVDFYRIQDGLDPLGFDIDGSGGAGSPGGNVPPSLGRVDHQEAATFERNQSINNPRNLALLKAAELGRVVRVYIHAGNMLRPNLITGPPEAGGLDDTVYFLGVYYLSKVRMEKDTEEQLLSALAYQKSLAVDSPHRVQSELGADFQIFLRHRTQMHYKFHLCPIQVPSSRQWRYANVSDDDPRGIGSFVPPQNDLKKTLALDSEQSLLPSKLLQQWFVKDKLYLGFLQLVPGQVGRSHIVPRRGKTLRKNIEAGVSEARADSSDEEPEIAPHHEEEEGEEQSVGVLVNPSPHIPSLQKRSITCQQACCLLQSVALGSFCRFLHVNIDSENRVGPLAGPAEGHKHDLPQFRKHFGGETGQVPECDHYLPKLGEVTQRHICPHCIRSYDVGTSHYIACMGGGKMRSKRKGRDWVTKNKKQFSDMVIGSVLMRLLGKVNAFKTWNVFQSPDGKVADWKLPGMEDLDSFIEFVEGTSLRSRKSRTSANDLGVWTSQQFINSLDPMLKTFAGFKNTMQVWKEGLPTLVEKLLEDTEDIAGRRDRFIKLVVNLFLQADCAPSGAQSLAFVATQIVLDLEEVVGDALFGPVGKSITGPGSRQGMAVMKDKDEIELLAAFYKLSTEELTMLGLYKKENSIFISLNDRELNLGDMEHCLCKIGIFAHRLPGGTRSFSNQPRLQVNYCYPICWKGVTVESACVGHFREVASMAIDAFKKAVDNGNWVSPAGILGERCWSSSASSVF